MRYEVKERFSEKVLYGGEADSLKALVVEAVKTGANLHGANLIGAIGLDTLRAKPAVLPKGYAYESGRGIYEVA